MPYVLILHTVEGPHNEDSPEGLHVNVFSIKKISFSKGSWGGGEVREKKQRKKLLRERSKANVAEC